MWKRSTARALCIALFLASITAWILSYQKELLLGHEGAKWQAIFIQSGSLGIVRNDHSIGPPQWSLKVFAPVPTFWNDHRTVTSFQCLGFYWDNNAGLWMCGIPFWLLTSSSAASLLLVWRKSRKPPIGAFPIHLTTPTLSQEPSTQNPSAPP